MKFHLLLFFPMMSSSLIRHVSPLRRWSLLGRRLYGTVVNDKRIEVSLVSKDKGGGVSVSWPHVDNAQSYHVSYSPVNTNENNLIVSIQNNVVLRNICPGVKYDCVVSPLISDKGLMDPAYCGVISIDVRKTCRPTV